MINIKPEIWNRIDELIVSMNQSEFREELVEVCNEMSELDINIGLMIRLRIPQWGT